MSYSFSVVAPSQSEAKMRVKEQLITIVAQQNSHEADAPAVEALVGAFIDIVQPRDDQEIYASVSGSVGWQLVGEKRVFNGAGLNVSVSLRAKIAT